MPRNRERHNKYMAKITFLVACCLTVFFLTGFTVHAEGTDGTKRVASPNWVHPEARKTYEGYRKKRKKKERAKLWQYSTNRPAGNIRGGGTTTYQNYKPFYEPRQKRRR